MRLHTKCFSLPILACVLRGENVSEEGKKRFIFFLMVGLLYASRVYAAPSLDQLVANLSTNIPQLMRLVTAFSYLLGIYFVMVGVILLKHAGEMRTQMSYEHSLKKPLLFLFVGAALIYLPTSITTGLATIWGADVPYGYQTSTTNDAWSQMIGAAFYILQFVGVISFIRGLVMLTHLSGHGGQPGTFGRSMTHMIAGILCINMYDTVKMVLSTFGLDSTII